MSVEAAARPQRDSEQFSSDVRGMFDRISGVYDLMNSAMTAATSMPYDLTSAL